MRKRPRSIALAVIRNQGKILVFKGSGTYNTSFYRPLGGGIEYGEYAYDALRREFREELHAKLEDIRFLKVLENIFTYEGRQGHEVVFMYEAKLSNKSLYEQEHIVGYEDDGRPFTAYWLSIEDCKAGKEILYPNGLVDLL